MNEDAELTHLRRTAEAIGLGAKHIRPPTHHRHRARDGAELAYVDWGGGGRPILFLHGYGLSSRSWDAVCLAMQPDYRCHALDQRGHGESAWAPPGDYTLTTRVSDAEHLLRNVVTTPGSVVVGQSLGGLVALGLATVAADEVTAVVIVDATPYSRPRATGVRASAHRATFATVDEAFQLAMQSQPRRDPQLLRANVARNLRRLPDGRWTWRYDQRDAMRHPEDRATRNQLLAEAATTINCPTLVVRGRESVTVRRSEALRLVRTLPNAAYAEIARAGHNIQGDQPRALASAISQFLVAANT